PSALGEVKPAASPVRVENRGVLSQHESLEEGIALKHPRVILGRLTRRDSVNENQRHRSSLSSFGAQPVRSITSHFHAFYQIEYGSARCKFTRRTRAGRGCPCSEAGCCVEHRGQCEAQSAA